MCGGWGAGMCLTYLHPTVDLQLQRCQWGSEGRGWGGRRICVWWMGGREVSDTYLHPRVDIQLVSGGRGELGWGVLCMLWGGRYVTYLHPRVDLQLPKPLCVCVGGGGGGDNSVL